MTMFLDEIYELGLCTDVFPYYVKENQKYEDVKWSILEKLYPEIRFEKVVHRAKIELTIAIDKIIYKNLNPDYIKNLNRKKNICPKPPGPKTLETIVREDGSRFYTIKTLWELAHELDISEAECLPIWQFEVYIPKLEASQHRNRRYFDYDNAGRETTIYETLYYVQDIDKYIKVTEAFEG